MEMLASDIRPPEVASNPSAAGDGPEVIQLPRTSDIRPEPGVRGEILFRHVDRLFKGLNRFTRRAVPREHNPFEQLGAVANTTFVVALASGIVLLFWYSPSVHEAYASLDAIQGRWSFAGFVRALHRYSSDACMLFVLMHGLQAAGARKFGGARWLGWVSGVLLVGFLWLDGWTGYWLVWDERAQLVATGTARVVDVLPIFSDPLTRSFLTNDSVNSLLFFLVFFAHMLIPLAMGLLLWLHVMRLNRARLFTGRWLTVVVLLVLVVLAIGVPVSSEDPADLLAVPHDVTADWYYLLPVFLIDRLQGGAVWILALATGVGVASIPWTLTRRRPRPARVRKERCNGCTLCYQDCPFNAIELVAGTDSRGRERTVAEIDPALCVGCGICVGSCTPSAIEHPLDALDVRRLVHRYAGRPMEPANGDGTGYDGLPSVEAAVNEAVEDGVFVAFACSGSAGGDLTGDEEGRCGLMPGYRVIPVPCIGWVHMLLVERAFRRGASGVLLVGCDSDPSCRKGAEWTASRLGGHREPMLRNRHVPTNSVRFVRADRGDRPALANAAAAFRQERNTRARGRNRLSAGAIVVLTIVALGAAVLKGGDAPFPATSASMSALVISFKLAGQFVESADEPGVDESVLSHMRRPHQTRRRRAPVRMRVSVDNEIVLERTYRPGGLFDDGPSVAIEHLEVSPGRHHVVVDFGDAPEPDAWSLWGENDLVFEPASRRVVLFDRESGFTWY